MVEYIIMGVAALLLAGGIFLVVGKSSKPEVVEPAPAPAPAPAPKKKKTASRKKKTTTKKKETK